jgi:hypothetical protein
MIERIELVRPLVSGALRRRYICDTATQRRRCTVTLQRAAPVRARTNRLLAPRRRPLDDPPNWPSS